MPNTFPSNSVATGPSFSSGNSSGGVFPTVSPSKTYVGLANGTTSLTAAQNVQGFVSDGDYIKLPTSDTASMTYFDKDNNQVTTGSWSGGIVPGDIHGNGNSWCGFMLDATDGLLYVMVTNTTAAPDEYLLASVTVAGVIANIGSFAAPTTPFNGGLARWTSSAGSASSGNLYREADGVGNFFLRVNTQFNQAVEELEFNSATGAIIGDVVPDVATSQARYKSASGIYIGAFMAVSTESANVSINIGNAAGSESVNVPSSGAPWATLTVHPMQWNGRIVMAGPAGTILGPRAYDVAAFDAYVDALGAVMGIT